MEPYGCDAVDKGIKGLVQYYIRAWVLIQYKDHILPA